MVAHAPRQMVATVWRQIVAGRVFAHNKTACSGLHHCLLVFKQRMKHSQRDGFVLGAGDGTRTRDSLLGRQVGTQSPLASYKLAPEAALVMPHATGARPTK